MSTSRVENLISFVGIIGLTILFCGSFAFAAPANISDLVSTEITVKGKERTIFCDGSNGGLIRQRRGSSVFQSFSSNVRNIRKRLAKLPAGVRKAISLLRKLNIQKAFQRASRKACRAINGGAGSGRGSGSGSGSATSYFEFNGDLNATGRARFGIPAGLNGNVIQGMDVRERYCIGCHGERGRGLTLSQLREAVSRSPMDYSASFLPDSDLVQILAYINRTLLPPN